MAEFCLVCSQRLWFPRMRLALIRYWLWKLGLYPDRCPWHKVTLIRRGFPGQERYLCPQHPCRMNQE